MNLFKSVAILILLTAFVFGNSSCVVYRKDNGNHRGWYKNPNNPHHPATTNPGNGNGNGHGNGHGKNKK
ncbi:MAG: hypothetical protein H0W73_09355 [Bacteroidetes bacterium]|nr:hypothetical protein [Bacteroidota bacterium]